MYHGIVHQTKNSPKVKVDLYLCDIAQECMEKAFLRFAQSFQMVYNVLKFAFLNVCIASISGNKCCVTFIYSFQKLCSGSFTVT